MKISKVGIDLIKSFEGCYLKAYRDVVNVLTIGFGHTGSDVKEGQVITQEEAENLLMKDLKEFEDGVMKLVTSPLNQNQFDSLVSFSFNLGLGNLGKSTLLKKINAKDYVGASLEFVKWNKAGGEVYRGLTRRRNAEKDLFVKPIPKPVPSVTVKKILEEKKVRTYKVVSGDTLSKIAKKLLKDEHRYTEIAKLNGIKSPYIIKSGQVLKIPLK